MKHQFSPFAIIMVFACLCLIGIWLIPYLSVQLTSDRSSTSLHVRYSWSNAPAKALEQKVTSKLEGLFGIMQNVQEINSTSAKQNGDINIIFKKGTDLDAVRFETATLIRQIYPKLPQGLSYPTISNGVASENTSSILSYSINANESPYFIKKYAEEHLLPRLASVKGVARSHLYGAAPYEWRVSYDPDKLYLLNVSFDEMAESINGYLQKTELGTMGIGIPNGNGVREMSLQMQYSSLDTLNWDAIPIKKIGERIIHLGQIAKMRFMEGEVNAYYRVNGLNTLNMVIYPEKGVNTIELAKTIKRTIQELKTGFPKGYQIILTQDTTDFLVKELQKIQLRTLFSFLILLLFIIAVYRNIKYLSILFFGIISNLLIAIIFYYVLQVQLQLYSFAGITLSFAIIVDNGIIMMDHYRIKGNKKVFLGILAATLTTIGAVLIIFLLEEEQRLNLWDFALVIAINIGASLLVSYYLIPALMLKLDVQRKQDGYSRKRKRLTVHFSKIYMALIGFLKRPLPKWGILLLFILAFGLPLHLAPQKLKGNGFWDDVYNTSLGSEWFSTQVRPFMEKALGGTLRLFTENVFENSYYAEPERTTLRVRAGMPEGSTIHQLNDVIRQIELYIGAFDEVELFETNISSYRNANINIYFTREHEFGPFPYRLKSLLENKTISYGGLDWAITGVGRGFSNAMGTGYKSERIVLEGYNYDKLYHYAEQFQLHLEKTSNSRVKDAEINSGNWRNEALHEYYLEFKEKRVAMAGVSSSQLFEALKNTLQLGDITLIAHENELQRITLVSNKRQNFNVWNLRNSPIIIEGIPYKLNELATIEKRKTGNEIKKYNQQYHLVVAYNFIGPEPLAEKFRKEQIGQYSKELPIGYRVFEEENSVWWDKDDKKQYLYLFVVLAIIFFICSILLESLVQPLAVIAMIPISFIGTFLTFYVLDLNFDQGGYASFILLSGISVNSALYIINDFNNLGIQYQKRKSLTLYVKAFNYKIIPIVLTITSTIAGLAPFVWGGQNEVFWFAFAAGSIGGLLFSLLGIFLFLPLFIGTRQRSMTQSALFLDNQKT